jgi:ECF transporter S component (folate family)
MFRLRQSVQELKNVKTLTVSAMMLALYAILHILPVILGLNGILYVIQYIPLAVIGYLYGGAVAMMVGGAGDVVGFFLMPDGMFSPWFTLSAILAGLLFGLLLYKKKPSVWRIAAAQFLVSVLIDFALNTFWLWQFFGGAAYLMLAQRLVTKTIMFVPVTALIYMLLKLTRKIFERKGA